MTQPPGALPHSVAATMLAVLADPRPTTNSIHAKTGLSKGGIHWALVRLKALGLVDWAPNRNGTIHATCTVVPVEGVSAAPQPAPPTSPERSPMGRTRGLTVPKGV